MSRMRGRTAYFVPGTYTGRVRLVIFYWCVILPGIFLCVCVLLSIVVATCTLANQRGEISAKSDWTVGRLKQEIEKKFPGKIPASLQRLFKGTLLLPSSMTLEKASEVSKNLSHISPGKSVELVYCCFQAAPASSRNLTAACRGGDAFQTADARNLAPTVTSNLTPRLPLL